MIHNTVDDLHALSAVLPSTFLYEQQVVPLSVLHFIAFLFCVHSCSVGDSTKSSQTTLGLFLKPVCLVEKGKTSRYRPL